MTSVDSGVETENDSNDSLATHDSQSMDLSPPVRANGEIAEPTPSTSVGNLSGDLPWTFGQQASTSDTPSTSTSSDCTFKESQADNITAGTSDKKADFVSPTPKWDFLAPCTPANEVDPPAGLSFLNIKQNMDSGSGYEVIGHGYSNASLQKSRRKIVRRLNKAPRDSTLDPLTKSSEKKLRRAVGINNCELVEKLLQAGVDPNTCDELKRSPLHLSACRGYTEIVQMLLQKGADPNQKDAMGNTPLHLAACTNHVSVVTLLLKAGTDVKSSDYYGRSPIQLAQTRLRLLQQSAAKNPNAWQVKNEVQKVIEMMLAYLNRFGTAEADAELLSSFSSRLTLTQTSQEVDQELQGLLASLRTLTIDKPGPS